MRGRSKLLTMVNLARRTYPRRKRTEIKYELLKKLKKKLERHQKRASSKEHPESNISANQDHLKKTALRVLKAKGGDKKANKNETKDFKNLQNQMAKYSSAKKGVLWVKENLNPRSVIVRGLFELSHEFV
ncbi:hypothetical protein CEXT_424881 [Caerostris extrusa]|uniref:Uncharacterized protein n=1 Tax=Caerostris extrusa TaxID=172846 RepID=A0AAV4MFM1_CAEEX|nr:hypothetical protein CEXT_424881 [Caerostris extrusa]